MARKPKETPMSDQFAGTDAPKAKKTRKPQGARTPTSWYLFVKASPENPTNPVTVGAKFRNPHKMAAYFPTAQQNGETLLVVSTPEE